MIKIAIPFKLYFWKLRVLLNKSRHKKLSVEPLFQTEFWENFICQESSLSAVAPQLHPCVYMRNGPTDCLVHSYNLEGMCRGCFWNQKHHPELLRVMQKVLQGKQKTLLGHRRTGWISPLLRYHPSLPIVTVISRSHIYSLIHPLRLSFIKSFNTMMWQFFCEIKFLSLLPSFLPPFPSFPPEGSPSLPATNNHWAPNINQTLFYILGLCQWARKSRTPFSRNLWFNGWQHTSKSK